MIFPATQSFLRAALFTPFLIAVASASAAAASLTVDLSGIESGNGFLRIGVFAVPETFLEEGAAIRRLDIPAQPGQTEAVFKDLPPGHYAISIYHDENSNGDLDTNFLGIPSEGYGFSNNPSTTLGPPTFEAASIMLGEDPKEIRIDLKY